MKTHRTIVDKVAKALGDGAVIQHVGTETNLIGQSGVHTFADDMISIVLNSENEREAYKNIIMFILNLDEKGNKKP